MRSANLTRDVVDQLEQLRRCNGTLYTNPRLLATLPGPEVLSYFGRCWNGVWKAYVTNALPYVCIRSWLAAGFDKSQISVLPQARLRNMTAPQLLGAVADATGLHYNKEVLHDRDQELVAHCEAADSASNRRYRPNEADAVHVNSHSGYTGHNAHARTRLDAEVWREFDRVANVHHAMFEELGLRQL